MSDNTNYDNSDDHLFPREEDCDTVDDVSDDDDSDDHLFPREEDCDTVDNVSDDEDDGGEELFP
jgi:hypothetical protein